MDFPAAVAAINTLLRTLQPPAFHSSWIRKHAPQAYRFIRNNVRTEFGGIDWDTFTRALDRGLQRRWLAPRRGRPARRVRGRRAVESIFRLYHDKLYTFLSPLDGNDERIRDVISIALVRLAQQGNEAARVEFIKLIRFTVDGWIEHDPKLSCWAGREEMLHERIEGCVRRYRYSGTFIGYLFKTLEYAGRGLLPVVAYSYDEPLHARRR